MEENLQSIYLIKSLIFRIYKELLQNNMIKHVNTNFKIAKDTWLTNL